MTRLLTVITLFFLSIGIYAQEKQVWACQRLESTALNWVDGKYERALIESYNVLLTIDGSDSEAKPSNSSSAFNLDCESTMGGLSVSCTDYLDDGRDVLVSSQHYFFHPESGRLAISSLFGVIMPDSDRNMSPYSIELYHCTKF